MGMPIAVIMCPSCGTPLLEEDEKAMVAARE